jgi:hypothetical protein
VSIDFEPGRKTLRGFARLWFPLFVAVLGSVLRWRFEMDVAALAVWSVGGGLALLGLASRTVARALFVALSVATYPIALVVSTIVLTVMYFIVLTPLGLWLRWRGHDSLRLRRRGDASHWEPYEQDDSAGRAVRQF